MNPLLACAATLYGLAMLRALVGILFFRPGPVLASFFLESLFLLAAAVSAVLLEFDLHLVLAWVLVGAAMILFLHGFRYWTRAPGPG